MTPEIAQRSPRDRPEAVEAGTVTLVGTAIDILVSELNGFLKNKAAYTAMSYGHKPSGEGKACERIFNILEEK